MHSDEAAYCRRLDIKRFVPLCSFFFRGRTSEEIKNKKIELFGWDWCDTALKNLFCRLPCGYYSDVRPAAKTDKQSLIATKTRSSPQTRKPRLEQRPTLQLTVTGCTYLVLVFVAIGAGLLLRYPPPPKKTAFPLTNDS